MSKQQPAIESATPNELERIKDLLLAEEQRKIRALERIIFEEKSFSTHVASTLPDSLRLADRDSERLSAALYAPLIRATAFAARHEPFRLSEALAPVIGTSIRHAVAEALRSFLQSIETLIENAFSVQGLRWRWEAFRTGVPLQTIVLKHSIRYEVEQVYVIHRSSGLLIVHLSGENFTDTSTDQDAVAGMLVAIQDFVKDAAFANTDDTLRSIVMKEHTVWLVPGEAALIACVIRGAPPTELHQEITQISDQLHRQFLERLSAFRGDLDLAPMIKVVVLPLLRRELNVKDTNPRLARAVRLSLGLGVSMLIALLAWSLYQSHVNVTRLWAALSSQRGLFVSNIEHEYALASLDRQMDNYTIHGMADPLGFDPDAVARQSGLQHLSFVVTPFISLDPKIVETRIRQTLKPPPSIKLAVDADRLILSGNASHEWCTRAALLASTMPYVAEIDRSAVLEDESVMINTLQDRIHSSHLYFTEKTALAPGDEQRLTELADWIKQLTVQARRIDMEPILTVIGYTDGTGTDTYNRLLRRERTETVRHFLEQAGINNVSVAEQSSPANTTGYNDSLRRVEIRTEILPWREVWRRQGTFVSDRPAERGADRE